MTSAYGHPFDPRLDLRPGGIFSTVMQSPEAQRFPNVGCYLEVIPNRKLVWTDALLPGFRPTDEGRFADTMGPFTAVILIEPQGKGRNTPLSPFTVTQRARRCTPRWASTMAGEPASISSSR